MAPCRPTASSITRPLLAIRGTAVLLSATSPFAALHPSPEVPMRVGAPWRLLVLALAVPVAAAAQQSDRLTLADYLEYETVSSPQLSPDGDEIVYARRWIDKVNDSWESSLYIMNADGTKPRALVEGGSPVWS